MLIQKHVSYAIDTLTIIKAANIIKTLRKLYIITITLDYMQVLHMLYVV